MCLKKKKIQFLILLKIFLGMYLTSTSFMASTWILHSNQALHNYGYIEVLREPQFILRNRYNK